MSGVVTSFSGFPLEESSYNADAAGIETRSSAPYTLLSDRSVSSESSDTSPILSEPKLIVAGRVSSTTSGFINSLPFAYRAVGAAQGVPSGTVSDISASSMLPSAFK